VSNTVTVVLQAIDNLSPKIDAIKGKASGLGSAFSSAVGIAATAGLALATGGALLFGKSLGEASAAQLNLMSLAGQYGALTNTTYANGGRLVNDLNIGFAKMAAALPGATQDYKDLGLGISDTLIKVNTVGGVFKEQAFKDQVMGITESLGVLKASSDGITNTDVALFFTKFVEGGSAAELQTLKLNERLPALMSVMERETKKLKGQAAEFKDLTNVERAAIMQTSLKALVPPELIRDLSTTAASQIEGVKTAIFDQQTGVLGLLRDTNTKLKGDQTVMAALGPLTESVIGPNGVVSTMGRSLQRALNIPSVDPMAALYSGIQGMTGMFKGMAGKLKGGLSNAINNMISGGLSSLNSGLGGMLQSGSGAKIGQAVGEAINKAINAARGALAAVNWGTVVSIVSRGFAVMLQAIGAAIGAINWGSVATAIGAAFMAIILGIGVALAAMKVAALAGVAVAIMGVAALVAGAIGAIIGAIGNMLSSVASAVGSAIASWGAAIAGAAAQIGGIMASFASAIISGVSSAFAAATAAGLAAISGLAGAVSSAVSGFVSAVSGAISSALSSIPIPSFGGGGGRKAAGTGTSGFMSLVNAESNLSPSGARPVIANSSELILTQGQQSNLAKVIASRTGGTNKTSINNFSPVINVNGATNPDSVASAVMAELEARFTKFQASTLG
jgi:hypothetical protein